MRNWKIPSCKAFIIFLIVGWILQACSPAQRVSTSLVSTPARDKYTEAFMTYMRLLDREGLTTVKEIRIEKSKPFIFILKPQNNEITDEDVKNITDLALLT